MELLLVQFSTILVIALASVGLSFLWRTCIYTRGAIFRPVGRLLDHWVFWGNLPEKGFGYKILRFIAYPLGRCIYCSSVHITYDAFFLINYVFKLELTAWWLVILIPIVHLLVIVFGRHYIAGNSDMERGDWDYISCPNPRMIVDYRTRSKQPSPLTKEEEDALCRAKGI